MSLTPAQVGLKTNEVDDKATIIKNLQIIYKDLQVGNWPFLELFYQCVTQSGTKIPAWKLLRRAQRALVLSQYFNHSLDLNGGHVECGVLRGFSALLLANIQKMRDPGYLGENLYLVDSFEGLSQPTQQDKIVINPELLEENVSVFEYQKGHFAVDIEHVKKVMQPFANTTILKGWIPDVFVDLPEKEWAFVHIDVDLYEPTYSCMEYFVPRLVKGGCIINDDFSSPGFPGGGLSWQDYCKKHDLKYIALDSGQAVFIRQ
ncbi:MAG: class I SAM-dependent methyltransferase [Magnetococcales bacterium]|nr:class I SAM-dependent methyltransferase [Magnetococcales bacterium]